MFATASLSPLQLDLLEKYFLTAAEVQILGERLADHTYEYWVAVAGKEHKEDPDEVLSIQDEELRWDITKLHPSPNDWTMQSKKPIDEKQ